MKKCIVLPLLIIILIFLSGFAKAETTADEAAQSQTAATETNETDDKEKLNEIEQALPDEAGDVLDGISPGDTGAGEKGIDAIIARIKDSGNIFKKAIKSAVLILIIVLLSSIVVSALEDGGVKDAVSLIAVIAISAACIENADSYITMGIETLNSLSDFSRVLLPTMCSAAVSSGAITSAAAKYAATVLFLDILLNVGIKVIVPIIMLYLASVIASAAFGKDTIGNISKFLKWACTTGLTVLVTCFTAYLSITGIITGKSDEMAAKVTKTALGTLLPVVGDTVASAASTIVAGAGILRNSIGLFGLLGVAAICVTPFLTLGAYYLAYKGSAALALAVSDKRMSDLVDGVGTAFGLMLALIGAGGVMLFISLVSSMKAVTG